MKATKFLTSSCRYCRYYKPQGRRGGICDRLQVAVESNWKACILAIPPFSYPLKIERVSILNSTEPTEASQCLDRDSKSLQVS